jgi:hypothetical protein
MNLIATKAEDDGPKEENPIVDLMLLRTTNLRKVTTSYPSDCWKDRI